MCTAMVGEKGVIVVGDSASRVCVEAGPDSDSGVVVTTRRPRGKTSYQEMTDGVNSLSSSKCSSGASDACEVDYLFSPTGICPPGPGGISRDDRGGDPGQGEPEEDGGPHGSGHRPPQPPQGPGHVCGHPLLPLFRRSSGHRHSPAQHPGGCVCLDARVLRDWK